MLSVALPSLPPCPVRVRLLVTPPARGAENMALDEALLARARGNDEVVVRVYGWARPTLSFGRNQSALGRYEAARLADRGVDVVRRPTGGRSVLHWREVTYSVTAPLDMLAPAATSVRLAFARINRLLVTALGTLGVDAWEAVPTRRTPRPDGAPCFETPTGGELVVMQEGTARKLVGSAQWQEDGALLQHGSILVDDDQRELAALGAAGRAAGAGDVTPMPAPATLRAALGRAPSLEEVADALHQAVRALEDPCATVLLVDATLRDAARARLARYEDVAWTWRR